jgi:hypothetical protein
MRIVLRETIKADKIYRKGEQFVSPFPKPIEDELKARPEIANVLGEIGHKPIKEGAEFLHYTGFNAPPEKPKEAVVTEEKDRVYELLSDTSETSNLSEDIKKIVESCGSVSKAVQLLEGVSKAQIYNWMRGVKVPKRFFAPIAEALQKIG